MKKFEKKLSKKKTHYLHTAPVRGCVCPLHVHAAMQNLANGKCNV